VFEETVKAFTGLSTMMKEQLILKTDLGIYVVDCTQLSDVLNNRQGQLFRQVCELFVSIIKDRSLKLKEWYQKSIRSLTSMIIQIDEFVEQKHSLDTIQLILPKIKEQVDTIKTLSALVE
jgi:dynein heavy chain